MNKSILFIIVLAFLFGCATTKFTEESAIIKNENEELKLYNSHPVNISLIENKRLLQSLNDSLITFETYDSLLIKLGRSISYNKFYENCICNTDNNNSYEEVVRAEYFYQSDSLLDIVELKMVKLIEKDSTYIMPYLFLGAIHYDNNECGKAIQYLNKAQKITCDYENSELNIFKAEIYSELGNEDMAIHEYENAFKQNNELIQYYWETLFDLYRMKKMYAKAEKLFYKIEELSDDQNFKINSIDLLISIYIDRNEYATIERILESLKDTTNSFKIEKELVKISILQDKYSEAKQKLLNLTSINLEYGATPVLQIPVFDSLDTTYLKSLRRLETTIADNPQNPDANFCYGYLYSLSEISKSSWEDKDHDKLRRGLAFIKKSKIIESEICYIIGYIYLQLGNNSDAKKYFTKIGKTSDYYPYSLINQAFLLEGDNLQIILSYLIEAQKTLIYDSNLIKKIADLYYYQSRDFKNAIVWYQKVLENEPNNNIASIELSESYLAIEDTQNALSIINMTIDNLYIEEKSWSRNWELGLAFEVKGDIFLKIDEFDDAQKSYINSIKFNPNNMDTRLSLAKVYYELDEIEKAEKTYLAVIDSITIKESIDFYINDYYTALSGLNWHYQIYEQNPIKRINLFEQAIKYLPSDDWCYRILGDSYSDQKKYYQAKQNFNKAIELNSNNYLNYSFFAYALRKEKKYEEAILNYNKAINVIQDKNLQADKEKDNSNYKSNLKTIGNFHSIIADIYRIMEEYELSILEYEKAISVTPDTTGILYKFDLACVFFDNKDYNNAIVNWKLVYKKNSDLFSLYNIGLSNLNIGEMNNLKNAKTYFAKVIDLGINNPEYEDLIVKSKEMRQIADTQINLIEWPTKIEDNIKSNNKTISSIAKIYQLTNDYRELNNMFLDGVEKTTPEYSESGGYIKAYNVSSKIFQSESLCDRFKSKITLIDTKNEKIIELKSIWSLASETRKDGIKLYSQGYYVKAKDYSGEFERGRAKIDVANQYYADGLKILKYLMQKNIEHFSIYGIKTINDMIKYYEHKE